MRLQWTAEGFRVIDAAKNTVTVATSDWTGRGDPPSVSSALASLDTGPDDPEVTISGAAEWVQFPPVHVVAIPLSGDEQYSFGSGSDSMELESGSYIARIDANVRVFLRFDGPAEFRRVGSDGVRLQFPDEQGLSMGFESRVGVPDEEVIVPETPEGVATALSALSVANENTSPDRTWPTLREQPPRIEFGEMTHVPSAISDRRPDTRIEVVVPPNLDYLLTGASLIHYLGADVTVETGATPRVNLDGRVEPLGTLPDFQAETAALLRRTFYLDCLARSGGPHGGNLSVSHVIDDLGLDVDALYEMPLSDRVGTYLDLPYEEVADEFPEWHLTMHVDPTYEHVQTLPHLLDNIPHFYLPKSEPLSKKEWLKLTVTDGYNKSREDAWRADRPEKTISPDTLAVAEEDTVSEETEITGEDLPEEDPRAHKDDATLRVTREISNVDLVKPTLGPGRSHGWLADKVPIDVFKALPEAYENRKKYLDDPGSQLSVVAVVNDSGQRSLNLSDIDEADMRDEHEEIVAHYERRAEELNIDLTLRENVSTAELGRIFERRNDLVHFIGHRDERGLECVNGYFSTSTLRESNAQTFFLNACGSFPEGKELVRKGSVGGGVTFESVTNGDAVKVGVAFARLIMNGFCIQRALDYTRQQLMTPKDYGVVGDGTHVLTQNDSIVGVAVFLFENDDSYEMLVGQGAPWITGGTSRGPFDESEGQTHLWGTDRLYKLSTSEVKDYLDAHNGPVIYDQKLYWSDEIRELL
jgi:hypothetical protein